MKTDVQHDMNLLLLQVMIAYVIQNIYGMQIRNNVMV